VPVRGGADGTGAAFDWGRTALPVRGGAGGTGAAFDWGGTAVPVRGEAGGTGAAFDWGGTAVAVLGGVDGTGAAFDWGGTPVPVLGGVDGTCVARVDGPRLEEAIPEVDIGGPGDAPSFVLGASSLTPIHKTSVALTAATAVLNRRVEAFLSSCNAVGLTRSACGSSLDTGTPCGGVARGASRGGDAASWRSSPAGSSMVPFSFAKAASRSRRSRGRRSPGPWLIVVRLGLRPQ
jgi:hypothetical protein